MTNTEPMTRLPTRYKDADDFIKKTCAKEDEDFLQKMHTWSPSEDGDFLVRDDARYVKVQYLLEYLLHAPWVLRPWYLQTRKQRYVQIVRQAYMELRNELFPI